MRSLTPTLIAREAAVLISNAPWELRGPWRFWSNSEFSITSSETLLGLDEFSGRYLVPATMGLLKDKRTDNWPDLMVLPEDSLTVVVQFRGVTVRLSSGWIPKGYDQMLIRLTMIYDPPHVDRSIPTWFWLGERAEAA